jgi:hypothetical protein
MNEEEKKAVEFVKKRTKELKKYAKRENELVYDDIILNLINKLQKENEEKTTILLAGAEKVKQLEKENEDITQQRDYYKARYNEFNEAFIKMKS